MGTKETLLAIIPREDGVLIEKLRLKHDILNISFKDFSGLSVGLKKTLSKVTIPIVINEAWLVGIPLVFIAAAVLGMPVYVAFAFTIADEITKIIFAVKRFKSGKWIQNIVECT